MTAGTIAPAGPTETLVTAEAVQILEDAAALLERDGWCRGAFIRADGHRCAMGAVRAAADMHRCVLSDGTRVPVGYGQERATVALAQVVAGAGRGRVVNAEAHARSRVITWNDATASDKRAVVRAMRRAVKQLTS